MYNVEHLFPIDSHCHLRVPSVAERAAAASSAAKVALSCCPPHSLICATAPSVDWDFLAGLARSVPAADTRRFAFGVHPWWAQECAAPDGSSMSSMPWVTKLVALLAEFPSAVVGEIGLDKVKCEDAAHFSVQVAVFEAQLDIAARLRRPVSIHCVRAFGPILDLLSARSNNMPPSIIFHGFSGSVDWTKSLLRLKGPRFFFGIGMNTTGRLKSFEELLAFLPKESILLESDAFANDAADAAQERLRAMAQRLHAVAGLTMEQLLANQHAAMQCGTQ
jgi:TatD DNase family protein